MSYEFRLDPVLRLNRRATNKSSLELSDARDTYDLKLADLSRLNLELKTINNSVGKKSAFLFKNDFLYKDILRNEMELKSEEVDSANQMVGLAYHRLMKARTKSKSLEKLQERGLEDYKAYMEHKERQALDEIATQRFNYKSALTGL